MPIVLAKKSVAYIIFQIREFAIQFRCQIKVIFSSDNVLKLNVGVVKYANGFSDYTEPFLKVNDIYKELLNLFKDYGIV